MTIACYLINKTPCVTLDLEIPESVWTGRSASYSQLKVFGCKAFAHVPKEKRSKLDDKAVSCIFLGYGNEKMGYRLWNPITKKLFRSRDVMFHEDQTGQTFKCLCSDNGGEYTSNEFRGYCSKHGIRHIKTVPGPPQHNGIAERMNHTILVKVRSMLKTANLAKEFWAAAVTTACYLINLTPCVPLDLETLESVWTGRSASYSHLKVFGCKAFAHVPKEKRSKLNDKAVPCIFIGNGNEQMGYRLWNSITKKLFRSRDVVFHEDQTIVNFDKNILENAE
ncbi:hypothetical protein ACLB2K_016309 [Fragaria x ananassa]